MSNPTSVPGAPTGPSPKERGKRAFQASRFTEAIQFWGSIATPDDTLKRALAEAHFRQAVAAHLDADGLAHLGSAIELMPNDPLYAYWHGIALHKNERFQEALTEYQRAESLGLAQAPGAAQRNPAQAPAA